ncbi:MAG TPA: nickel insertion protein, partial [Candidatus Acidoferrum sp.]|nr:nickel insertion protein [Candidatus Acidoferrum sp.]
MKWETSDSNKPRATETAIDFAQDGSFPPRLGLTPLGRFPMMKNQLLVTHYLLANPTIPTLSMRMGYLDCFSGMSGDMFLGALVDAGVPPDLFQEAIAALNIGARLEITRTSRSGISATKADVYAYGEKDLPREVYWQQREASHSHEHSHSPGTSHEHQPIELREHNYGIVTAIEKKAGTPVPH